jgi:psiF repeat
MRRSATIALVLTMTAALFVPQAVAQTTHRHRKSEQHHTLTPEQRARNKAIIIKFKACHKKAVAQKVPPKERYGFMKSCLAGN